MGRAEDVLVLDLAERQHGVIGHAQVVEAGMSVSAIKRRVGQGRLVRVGSGVLRVAGAPQSWRGEVMASVLSIGGLAAASHMTAGHLWGVMERPDTIEVVVGRRGVRRGSFVMHQSTDLELGHVTLVDGIPTTTTARTAIDVGVPHGLGSVARFVDEARRRGLLDLAETARLHHRLARRGRNGIGPSRKILAERLEWDQITESQLEDRFLRLVQRADLPEPVSQHLVRDDFGSIVARLDFAYPERMVAIELDSIAHHTDGDTFRTDRRRQNRLIISGWTVLRYTWWDVLAGEEWVLDSLAAALASSRR